MSQIPIKMHTYEDAHMELYSGKYTMFYLLKAEQCACIQINLNLYTSCFLPNPSGDRRATYTDLSFIQYVKQFVHFSKYLYLKQIYPMVASVSWKIAILTTDVLF